MSIKGNDLSALVRIEGYPRYTNENGAITVVDQFVCQYALWESLIPDLGTVGDTANTFLTNKEVEREGDAARITLTYKSPQTGIGGGTPAIDGDPVYYSIASINTDVDGKFSPSVQWVSKRRVRFFTPTASSIIQDVGKRGLPPGLAGGTSEEWLKVSFEIQESEEFTEITEAWEWKNGGWPSTYSDA